MQRKSEHYTIDQNSTIRTLFFISRIGTVWTNLSLFYDIKLINTLYIRYLDTKSLLNAACTSLRLMAICIESSFLRGRIKSQLRIEFAQGQYANVLHLSTIPISDPFSFITRHLIRREICIAACNERKRQISSVRLWLSNYSTSSAKKYIIRLIKTKFEYYYNYNFYHEQ